MKRRLLNIADVLGDRDLAALLEMASWKSATQVVVNLDGDAWKAWANGFEPPEAAVAHQPIQFLRPPEPIDPGYDPSIVRKGGCCDRPKLSRE